MTDAAYKRPYSVLVVVYTAEGQVLLLERTRPEGFWQSVTGSLEPGETPARAARRELAEETGIEAWPEDCRRARRFPIAGPWRARYGPGVRYNLEHRFALRLPAPVAVRPHPEEHRRARWLPRDEAAGQVFSWTNREAILELVPGRPHL